MGCGAGQEGLHSGARAHMKLPEHGMGARCADQTVVLWLLITELFEYIL